MRGITGFLVFSTALLFCVHHSEAQKRNFNIYSLSVDNGLPSNDLTAVFQDSYGFLWIGSYEGVLRWDGYTFRKYQHDDADTTSIDHNIIYSIFEDAQKRLWVGTIDGLNLYDRKTDAFVRCRIGKTGEKIPVNAIAEDAAGKLWLGTSSGLCLYDHSSGKAEWFADDTFDTIFCLTIDSDDNIWTGTFKGGVKKFDQKSRSFKRFPGSENGDIKNIRSILADDQGLIWIGTFDKGLWVINGRGKLIQKITHFSNSQATTLNTISHLYQDKNRRIWVGIGKDALYYLDAVDQEPVRFDKTPLNSTLNSFNSVSCITEDSFGNIWFATAGSGLFYSNVKKNVFENYLQQTETVQGLTSTVITCLHEDEKGRLWIGTESGGFLRTDSTHQNYQLYTSATHGLSNNAITDIKSDEDGSLWISTWSGGIMRFNPETERTDVFAHRQNDLSSLPLNDAKVILPEDTIVWIGTHGEGLAAYDKKRKSIIHYKNNNVLPFPMNAPGWINHLYRDSRKWLWISTYSGLFVFDGTDLRHFQHATDTMSLSSNSVNMVTEETNGTMWVATEGGLDRFDAESGSFTRYRKKHDLPQVLKSIVVDHHGNLWMSSNSGIHKLDPSNGRVIRFDVSDGLQGNSFFLKSALRTSDDRLYFGGPRGFNVFHPDSLKVVAHPNYFYLADLYIYNERQTVRTANTPLEKVLSEKETLTLEPDQNYFSIDVASVNLYSPLKTEYAYQLEGLDNKWIDLRSERKITFSGLDPGSYTLRVRYRGGDGIWHTAEQMLNIVILPPWYKTLWFKVALVALASGLIVAVFYLRVAAIKKRNRVLRAEVKKQTYELSEANSFLVERTEEIKLQNERLEEYNREILRQSEKILHQQRRITEQNHQLEKSVEELQELNKTKDHFFSILAHDLRNPISALTGISEFMKSNFLKLEKKDALQYLDSIHKSSNAIHDLLINLLNWSRTQSKNIEYSPRDFNVSELLQKSVALLHSHVANKHISLSLECEPEVTAYADYNMVDTAIRNILGNAIKFTEYNGEIKVKAYADLENINIAIKDNGVGMDKRQIEALFQLDKNNVSVGTAGEKGTGLGLIITRDFITANHGELAIESTAGHGTTFTISLPRSRSVVQPMMKIELQHKEAAEAGFWEAYPVDKLIKLKGQKILIVDDNAELRTYLKLILSETFEIFEASNGRDALALATDIQPSVVVADLVMPVMNGLELCRLLKTDVATSHIPVILLTSQWEEQSQLKGYEAGADIYLTKPLKRELLIRVILNMIQNQEKLRSKIQSNILSATPFEIDTTTMNKVDEEFISRLVAFIETNVSDQSMDARTLCTEFAVSRTVLYSKVKSLTGQSVHELVKSIRLKRAVLLLLEGRLNISQVSVEVGFNSHSYFDKCFTRQYGVGPKEYVSKRRASKSA